MSNPGRQPEIDAEPPAATGWLAGDPPDLHPDGSGPRAGPQAARQLVLPGPEAG
jgi:hypothetical protein